MDERSGSFANLPHELDYLVEPAMKYGVHQFEGDVFSFVQNATESDMEELARVAELVRLNHHEDLIGRFLDEYPITDFAESANLYFLFGVIDAADVAPDDDSWNSVDAHIESLQRHGSYRLASGRMWAARFLADFGPEARAAIPHLSQALQDEDHRVRVWAHFSLAVIVGRREEHADAIRAILASHNVRDGFNLLDEVGSEAEAALARLAEYPD